MQQGQAPIGAFCVLVHHGLVDLVAPEQQTAPVLIAAGHPGGVEPGDVQALAADVDRALPPGQGLGDTEPIGVELQVGGVALEQDLALVAAGQDRGDLILITPCIVPAEQSVLDHAGGGVDLIAVYVVVAGHEQQPLMG